MVRLQPGTLTFNSSNNWKMPETGCAHWIHVYNLICISGVTFSFAHLLRIFGDSSEWFFVILKVEVSFLRKF